MGEVVQLRQDPDKALSDAWDAMVRAHQIAIAQPSIRNMARAVRAWEAFAKLTGMSEAYSLETLA